MVGFGKKDGYEIAERVRNDMLIRSYNDKSLKRVSLEASL